MQITKKKLINFALSLTLALSFCQILLVSNTQASMWTTAKDGGLSAIGEQAFEETSGNPRDIRIIAANVIKSFLGLLGLIFLFLIISAGYKYMSASGDETKIEEALGQIKAGVIGLVIVMAAFSIAIFVTEKIYESINTSTS